MYTDFLRDQIYAIAWLALMSAAWFGWAQEDPKPRLRPFFGVASVVALLLAIAFGILVWRDWDAATALDGRYWIFGVIVLAEVGLVGGGCFLLARNERTRWFGWWIALCVAIHLIPLAWVFGDWSYAVLAAVQLAGLLALRPTLTRGGHSTSRWAAPLMGATFLAYAAVSAIVLFVRDGYPF